MAGGNLAVKSESEIASSRLAGFAKTTRFNSTSMKQIILFIAFCACFCAAASASDDFTGTRAQGVGRAFTAVSGDIDDVYQNPAGLADIKYEEAEAGVNSFYSLGDPGFEGSAVYVRPGWGIQFSDREIDGAKIQQTGFSFARKTIFKKRPFRYGATVKLLSSDTNGSTQFLSDAGVQADIRENLSLGFAARNMFSGNSPQANTAASAGLVYKKQFNADLSYSSSMMYLSAGWEKQFFDGLMVFRMGYAGSSSSAEPSLNAGLSSYLWPIGFDTAFSWPTGSKEYASFRFAVHYRFNGERFSDRYMDRSLVKAVAPPPKPGPDKEDGLAIEAAAKRQAKPRPQPPVTWPQHYTAKEGDTLRDIAEKFYNNSNKWQVIYNANAGKTDRGIPKAGEDFVIPEP